MAKAGKPRRVGLISLGCPKNLVDSELMLGRLRREGHEIVDPMDDADTVIVNTCGFIDQAKQESIDTILEVAERKERGEVDRLVVAGCMVNRFGRELAEEVPEIDGFVGLDELAGVSDVVRLGSDVPQAPAPSHVVFNHHEPRLVTTSGYAYLKVAEGCDNPCTFCAIPSWRGRFRSRTIDSLVEEARRLEADGTVELCLIAQDTTRYGEDLGYGRHGLLRLVEALLAGTTIPWIRFHYAYPTTLDEDLLLLMGSEPRFVSYLDIPLQHSHPEILRRMKRGGSASRFLRLLDRARNAAPEIFLRSTFIVGFPGETAEQFEDLERFIDEARLDHVGAFGYSPEPGTPAAELDQRLPARVIQERYERLLERQRTVALERRLALVGRRVAVLVEGVHPETDHLLIGRHQGQAPGIDGSVLINDGSAPTGRFVEVEISAAYPDDLVGHIVGPESRPEVQVSQAVTAATEHEPAGAV
jgi:ribosomal protein S12 methylthiotransferase